MENHDGYGNQKHQPMRAVIVTSEDDDQHNDRLPTQPSAEVESEKLEVIEIRSDGTSGHLTPGHDRN